MTRCDEADLLAVNVTEDGEHDTASVTVPGQVQKIDYVSEEYGIPTFLCSKLHPDDCERHH